MPLGIHFKCECDGDDIYLGGSTDAGLGKADSEERWVVKMLSPRPHYKPLLCLCS